MDDKNEQIYTQYLLQIDNVYKKKGIVYLQTKDGLYMVKAYNYTEKKIKLENAIKQMLEDKGYSNTDMCIPNKEGEYISLNKYQNKYIVKRWSPGRECDITSSSDMVMATTNLARLHQMLKNSVICTDDISKLEEKDWVKEYTTYINELKRVKKYIINKKKKNRLELDILKCIDYYYKQSVEYRDKLAESSYPKMYKDAVVNTKICHGNYTHHAVLIEDNINNKNGVDTPIATINFDRVHIGVQIYDLYTVIRKAMEKSNWDIELAKDIIVAYDEELPLSVEEREVIIILLGYPEKFRKLMNSYFNGKKSWLSIRIFEKLNEVVVSEENRWRCIRELEDWFGVEII